MFPPLCPKTDFLPYKSSTPFSSSRTRKPKAMAMATGLEIKDYYYSSYKTKKPRQTFINTIFTSTLGLAAKSLVSFANSSNIMDPLLSRKWSLSDHFRFATMLMTWASLWFLRLVMDYFPCLGSSTLLRIIRGYTSSKPATLALPSSLPPPLLTYSSSSSSLAVSSASALALPSSSVPTLDMILYDGNGGGGVPSIKPLGRALSHVLALLNEIPAKSSKYQFAMTMADRIMEENARSGQPDLAQVNRFGLASAFSRTSSLLYRSLQQAHWGESGGAWPIQILRALPLGSHFDPYIKGMNMCVGAVVRFVKYGAQSWSSGGGLHEGVASHSQAYERELATEKLAQELLWITSKLREYGAIDEALAQWSYASSLASACFGSSPRVKGLIIKIFAMLSVELSKESTLLAREVKFGILVLWLPLCCQAGNGFSYPTLSGFEKVETERAIDDVLLSLPPSDQEIILTNWIQDFTVSSSDWPNLQASYDRWCQLTRSMAVAS